MYLPFCVLHRSNSTLFSGSFALLTSMPYLLDFDLKRTFFIQELHKGKTRHYQTLHLNVHRDTVFEDSYQQIIQHTGDEVKYGRLSVRFANEEGVDAGGVSREWYQVLSRQMFNPNFALFVSSAVDKVKSKTNKSDQAKYLLFVAQTTYQPNHLSSINTNHLAYFKFVGRIIAKAIYDNRALDAHFTRSFYKHILGKKVDYRDMEAVDPEYFKSLDWIVNNDITGVLDLTFTYDVEDFGMKTEVELKPEGSQIPVTEVKDFYFYFYFC